MRHLLALFAKFLKHTDKTMSEMSDPSCCQQPLLTRNSMFTAPTGKILTHDK